MTRWLAAVFLLAAASAVVFPIAATSAAGVSAQSALMAADRAFSKPSVAKGRDFAMLATMAGNARLSASAAKRRLLGQAFRNLRHSTPGILSREPQTANVSADGRLGWTDGRWLLTVQGAKNRRTGHCLTIWTRQPSGAWKIQADMGTPDPAP